MELTIHDIKLKDMSNEEIRVWAKNLASDNVVLLRNQDCEKSDLVRIYDSIGRVCKPVDRKTGKKEFFADDDYPQLMRVTNKRKDGEKIGIFADKELDWHSNGNAREQGKECCVALYCVEEGTDSVTSFCDMRQSYRDLSDDVKEEVSKIECLYKFENGTSSGTSAPWHLHLHAWASSKGRREIPRKHGGREGEEDIWKARRAQPSS